MKIDTAMNKAIKERFFPSKDDSTKPHYLRVPRALLSSLTTSESLFLAQVLDHMSERGKPPWLCWASHETIGKGIGLSRAAAARIAINLKRKDLLLWRRTGRSNQYQMSGKLLECLESDVKNVETVDSVFTSRDVTFDKSDVADDEIDVGNETTDVTGEEQTKINQLTHNNQNQLSEIEVWVDVLDVWCRIYFVEVGGSLPTYPAISRRDRARISELIVKYGDGDIRFGAQEILNAVFNAVHQYDSKPSKWLLPTAKNLITDHKLPELLTNQPRKVVIQPEDSAIDFLNHLKRALADGPKGRAD